jgi:hypothetical protein
MTAAFPLAETLFTGLASSMTLAAALAPASAYLAPDLQPLAIGASAAWTAWRLLALDRALAHRRAWRTSPSWEMASDTLARLKKPAGMFLGNAFRWNAAHTQILETALARDGALTSMCQLFEVLLYGFKKSSPLVAIDSS